MCKQDISTLHVMYIELPFVKLESPSIWRDAAEVAETHLDISLTRLADTRLFLRME